MIPVSAYIQTFLQVICITYTCWYALTVIAYQFIPFGLLPALLAVVGLHLFALPPPSSFQLQKILGRDLHEQGAHPNDNNNVVVQTIAHRGAGLDAPENSLIAFKQCANEGSMCIEFDVSLTKDGVPVVFHDSTLERMTNDKRLIASVDYRDLKVLDIAVNHPFSERFSGTEIPTLEATINQLLTDKQKMFIDIKENDSRIVEVIAKIFEKHPELYNNAIVTTFFPNIIYAIRKRNSKVVCSLAYRPYFFSHESYSFLTGAGQRRSNSYFKHWALCLLDIAHAWALPNFTCYLLGLSVILLHRDAVSPQSIKEWRDRGIRPCIWTINKPIDKQYVARTLRCTYLTDTLVGEASLQMSAEY